VGEEDQKVKRLRVHHAVPLCRLALCGILMQLYHDATFLNRARGEKMGPREHGEPDVDPKGLIDHDS
jgi:hypothetical protein